MDIKANEYVRTNGGHIGIFQKYEEEGISQWFTMLQNGTLYTTATKAIVKHSKNIIDLIEVGDIVEYQVNSLSELKVGRVKKYRDARSNKEYLGVEGFDITKIYIQTILTHEQYNANCYKIEQK